MRLAALPRRTAVEAPLWVHCLILLAVLAGFAGWVDARGHFSVDEGIAAIQAQALAQDGSWVIDYPLSEVDPENQWFPLRSAELGDNGFVAYAKHPLYPTLLSWAQRAAGIAGMVATSTLAVTVASLCAALLARRLEPDLATPTLYVTGLASPLFFDSTLILAHALAAAAVGGAAVLVARHLEGSSVVSGWLLGATALGAAALMLRTEATLLWLAMLIVVIAMTAMRLTWRNGVLVLAAVVTGAGLLIDRWWYSELLGSTSGLPQPPGTSSGTSTGSLLSDRTQGLVTTTLRVRSGPAVTEDLLIFGALVALGLAVYVVRRSGPLQIARTAMVTAGALALGFAVFAEPSPISGVLVAFPLLWFGLALGGRPETELGRVLLVTFALLAAGVAATQYRQGGGLEWGARYMALGLPLIVPVAVAQLVRGLEAAPTTIRRPIVLGCAIVSLALVAVGLTAQRDTNRFTTELETQVVAADEPSHLGPRDDDARPVVVSNEFAVPQVLWSTYGDRRWLRLRDDEPVAEGATHPAVAALVEAGVDRFTFVTSDFERDRRLLGDDVVLGRDDGIGGWSIVSVCPRANMRSQGCGTG